MFWYREETANSLHIDLISGPDRHAAWRRRSPPREKKIVWPEGPAKALAIADNRVGELDLEWDVDMLKQVHADGLDVSPFWTADEFRTLCAESSTGRTDENAVVEPGPTDIVRGDRLVLGRHRLVCGDATSAGDVRRLLDGATPVLMATDPPYGVSYDPAWRHRVHPTQRTAVGRVLHDDRAAWAEAWRLFPGRVAALSTCCGQRALAP